MRAPSRGRSGWVRALLGGGTRPPPWIRTSRPGGRRRPWPSPPLLDSLAAGSGWWGWRGMGGVGVGAVGGRAGVGQADLAAGGQGALGLAGLISEQAAAFGRLEQALVDLVVVEGAGGDQVVEVAGGFPQLLVALALGGGGDPGQFLSECRPPIARSGSVAHRDGDDRGGSVGLAMLQSLQERSWHPGHCGI